MPCWGQPGVIHLLVMFAAPVHPLFATITTTVVDLDVKGKSDLPRGTGAASHSLQNEVLSVLGMSRASTCRRWRHQDDVVAVKDVNTRAPTMVHLSRNKWQEARGMYVVCTLTKEQLRAHDPTQIRATGHPTVGFECSKLRLPWPKPPFLLHSTYTTFLFHGPLGFLHICSRNHN